MLVTRILDLAVLAMVAVAILLPRPDVKARPAIRACDAKMTTACLTADQKARIAELQAQLLGHPDAAEPALELANLYLDGKQPSWALATVNAALAAHPTDFRLHQVRALSYADRFEPAPAHDAAARALFLCETPADKAAPSCGDATHARLALLERTLRSVRGIDMRKVPYLAKERIFEQLHPVWIPKPKPGDKNPPPPIPQKP